MLRIFLSRPMLIGILIGAILAYALTSAMSPLASVEAGGIKGAVLPIGGYVLAGIFALFAGISFLVYHNMKLALVAFGAAAGAAFWAAVLWMVFAVMFNTF